MKNLLLLPRRCRPIGCILLPLSVALMVAFYSFNFSVGLLKYNPDQKETGLFSPQNDFILSKTFSADYTGTVGMVLTFVSLFMIAFSREKREDEYVGFVRLRALQISVYANYIILGLIALTLFGTSFLMVMEVNLFTIPILFIIIYQYLLHIKPRFSKPTGV